MTSEDAHYAMVISAIRAELEFAAALIQRELDENRDLGQPIPTDAYQRYGSQFMARNARRTKVLKARMRCLVQGHDDYVCEKPCCRSIVAWCTRCGRSHPAPTIKRTLAPATDTH